MLCGSLKVHFREVLFKDLDTSNCIFGWFSSNKHLVLNWILHLLALIKARYMWLIYTNDYMIAELVEPRIGVSYHKPTCSRLVLRMNVLV